MYQEEWELFTIKRIWEFKQEFFLFSTFNDYEDKIQYMDDHNKIGTILKILKSIEIAI